jgi:hypothetical protein
VPSLNRFVARAAPLLWVVLVVAAALALCTWVSGGFRFTVLGVRVASFSVRRPFTAAAIAGLLLAVQPLVAARLAALIQRGLIPLSLLGCAAFALIHAAPVAAASDMHGYVAQARDWWSGSLSHPDWIDDRFFPAPASAPLGYLYVNGAAATVVPAYPPGTSLHMAGARVLGEWAVFAIAPLGALALVLGTYGLGRTRFDPTTGAIAAGLIACNPILLAQATVPMSDTLAAAYWTWSLALAASSRGSLQACAGVLAGLAVVVRPNLAPLVLGPAGCALAVSGLAGVARIGAGALPGVAFLGWHNAGLYGAATRTGYGSVSALFSMSHIPTNVRRYGGWLWQTISPLPLVGFVLEAAVIMRQRRLVDLPLVLFVVTTVAIYLVYQPWPHWTFARFLLPALPVVVLMAVSLARRAFSTRPLIVAALMLIAIGWQMDFEQRSELRRSNEAMFRFKDLPDELRRHDLLRHPLVTRVHSGSLRYYGGITAFRWDVVSRDELRRGVQAALDAGQLPLLVDDSDDRDDFERVFGPLACWADSSAPLLVLTRHAEIRVLRMHSSC